MKETAKIVLTALFCLLFVFTACNGEVGGTVIKVTEISFAEPSMEAFVGSELNLTITIAPDDASDKSVEWTSDNVDVATVDQDGKVECIGAGTANITVKAKDGSGLAATCTITVKNVEVPVTSIELNWENEELKVGESRVLIATVTPENASNKRIKWSSSDDTVAVVDASGAVTAKKEGVATITATTEDGGKTATCKVSVVEAKYTVTFNTDGGSAVVSATVKAGEKVTKPVDPTKKGYAFVKWTLDGKDFDFNTPITKDIELKAVWETSEPVVQVKLKYEVRGESEDRYAVVTGYESTESTNAAVAIPSTYVDPESGKNVPVKEIEGRAFAEFANLTSVTIADSVETIWACAFLGCKNLKSIVVPESVKNYGKGVFKKCTSLTSVTLPESLDSISEEMFMECESLTSITIPGSVETIYRIAFAYCTRLTSIEIPYSVKKIESYAFQNCTGLKSITIPISVTTIEKGVFYDCTGLTEILCPSALKTQAEENNTFEGIDPNIVKYY